ncbi:MAG: hypothetical protein EXQ48_00610 [Acidobacteria bacterium]|nr:hypothetical protein [Acidobacteriota bacterium]
MKTIIKLAIALAVINAAFHAGEAAWRYYQLKDATQQLITFGSQEHTTELHNRILQKATELQVPLLSENVAVHREGTRTFVDASYTQPVEYFPNQVYPVNLTFSVEAFSLNAGRPEDAPQR